MNCLTRLSRLAAAATLGGTLACPPVPTHAQDAPLPPLPQGGAAPAAAGDPPARAGRVARLAGTVSFHGPGADHWDPATLNFPLTSGDALWTEPQARAAIDVSANRITLAGGTELDIDTLDAQALNATEAQGEIYLRIRRLAPGESYSLRTPRGPVSITAPGRYGIVAGDTQTPTTVTVDEGSAQVIAAGVALTVMPGQTATLTGDHAFQGSVGEGIRDPFLTEMLAGDAPPPPAAQVVEPVPAAPPPPMVDAMPGAQDLAANGDWQPSPAYGTVWYPHVDPGWVPYRHGHWAYVAPWGWTWVDDAPWGFAPFHYGRWVQLDDRWAWSPGYAGPGYGAPGYMGPAYVEPVYAPALVSFVGFGVGVGVGVGVGLGLGGSVGWFPLGFGEPYRPWYGGSPTYIRNINRTYVSNTTNINTTNITNIHYANRNVATVVPNAVMTGSRPVAAAVQQVTPQQLAAAHPSPIPPVRPTAATAGVTPGLAHQLNLPPAPASAVAHPAPGPRFTPTATGNGHAVAPAAVRPAVPSAAVGPRPPGAPPAAGARLPQVPRATAAPIGSAPAGSAPIGSAPIGSAPRGSAPGPAIAPRAQGAVSPVLHAPATAGAPHAYSAPGPAIAPRAPGAVAPALRPAGTAPPLPGTHPGPGTPARSVGGAGTAVARPPVNAPAAVHPQPAPHPPAQPHVAPRPAAQPQATPRPAPPRYVPPPQQHYVAPPPPPPHYAPPPAHYAPPPAPRPAPANHNCANGRSSC